MKINIQTGVFIGIVAVLAFFVFRQSEDNFSPSKMNESTAIESLKAQFLEFKGYPIDNLPPRSIKTEKAVDGWYVAFVQEGSGRPIILAKCYFVDNAKNVTSVGIYSPKYSDYSISDISLQNCQPKDPNYIPGGEVPSIPSDRLIGGDRDEHGCLGPAGYTWCAVKNKCLRIWEEECRVEPVLEPVACTMDALQCSDGSYVGRSGPNCEFVCPK